MRFVSSFSFVASASLLVACARAPAAPAPASPAPSTVAAGPAPKATVPAELTSAMVQPTLAEMEQAAFRCYALEFGGQETEGGRVLLDWVIQPSGAVASASIVESSIESEAFAGCVLKAARALRFPAAERPTGLRKPYEFRRAAESTAAASAL